MEKINTYYLDLDDSGYWLIKKGTSYFSAGYDKEKVVDLINRLNGNLRANVHQEKLNKISVCWGCHEKHEDCYYEPEI